ncbi:MAG: arylsulfatase [Opitutaceae bacterium]|nr:arylsulfatase [Opitutaceae bacterium]
MKKLSPVLRSILYFLIPTFLLFAGCANRSNEPTGPTNFIVIFIDDLGYADIGPFGSRLIRTPNLDKMAAEGMKLYSFYVASSVCTPSRAALLTGSYPQRVDMSTNALPGTANSLVLFPGDPKGLNPNEITIAKMLKEKGYATACIGKWHLGDQKQWLPTNYGFDSYFGVPYSNNMGIEHETWNYPPLPLMRGNEVIESEPDQGLLTKRYTEEALVFLDDNKDNPFFIYLPHTMVHLPRYASPDFEGKSNNGLYGDIIEELDWSVGKILDKLVELDIDKKTMVLFFSDNGGTRNTDTYQVQLGPLRGRKGTQFEGGYRVCSLAWAPGYIPAGSECNEITTSMDLMPTFAKLSRANVPDDRIIDGKDINALLRAESDAKSPHEAFFYREQKELYAVRSGPWKLFLREYRYGNETVSAGSLFNLEEEMEEVTDVSSVNPQVVSRLQTLAEASRNDLGDGEERPGKNIRKAAYIPLEEAVTLTPRAEPWSKVKRRIQ